MPTSIFVGVCNSQDILHADFFWSFVQIRNGRWPTRVFRSRHPWDVVRNNVIISEFLKSGCTVLAKMDIDQVYPPDYFERLIPLVEQFKVSGPMICDRWEQNGYTPLAFQNVNGAKFPTVRMDLTGLSGVMEIPYPHTNLFYHREVLEKIPPPWYEAYLSNSGLERGNHVDFNFIDKIHKAGYKVMIDLDCEVKHMETRFIGKKECQVKKS